MTKLVMMCAVLVSMTACAVGADEDPQTTTENSESRAAETSMIGYCQLDSLNHKTGYCVGGSQLCSSGLNTSACVPGSNGVSPQAYAFCGVGKYDMGTRCMFNGNP